MFTLRAINSLAFRSFPPRTNRCWTRLSLLRWQMDDDPNVADGGELNVARLDFKTVRDGTVQRNICQGVEVLQLVTP